MLQYVDAGFFFLTVHTPELYSSPPLHLDAHTQSKPHYSPIHQNLERRLYYGVLELGSSIVPSVRHQTHVIYQ
jgi:hypothetical protein